MSSTRHLVSSLDIAADGTMTGDGVVQHFAPLGTKLKLSGELKECGERRWIEIRAEIIERPVVGNGNRRGRAVRMNEKRMHP
jgi:hypothetical protein